MAEDEAHGAEPQDAAAEAFEALRAEVAQLCTVLEGLPTTAPDYSPTLAAIAQSLAAMEARPASELERAGTDGGGDFTAGSLGSRSAAHGQREPARVGAAGEGRRIGQD